MLNHLLREYLLMWRIVAWVYWHGTQYLDVSEKAAL